MKFLDKHQRLRFFLTHAFYWIITLLVPVYFFYSLVSVKTQSSYFWDYLRIGYTCIVLIILFYFTYYYLIPKYLFDKNYIKYSIVLFIIYIALSGIPIGITNDDSSNNGEPIGHEFFDLLLLIMMYMISFLVSLALRMNARWQYTEKERMSAQLSYLKSQINPHFLFNTLNGIYSVTIDKAPQAADMIEKLSTMMRYTLHETKADFVPLEKEIRYIQDYIELQKGRFDESVKLNYIYEGNFGDNQVAPLLLIPFIENAFKHGVNSEQDSDILIKISCQNNELTLYVKNNKVIVEKGKEEESGLGIENTRNRLNLIYPTKYLLSIQDSEKYFIVSLHLILI